MLPLGLVNLMAICLPWVELIVGLALLAGVGIVGITGDKQVAPILIEGHADEADVRLEDHQRAIAGDAVDGDQMIDLADGDAPVRAAIARLQPEQTWFRSLPGPTEVTLVEGAWAAATAGSVERTRERRRVRCMA